MNEVKHVSLTLKSEDIAKLDHFALELDYDRSKLIRRAIRELLTRLTKAQADAAYRM